MAFINFLYTTSSSTKVNSACSSSSPSEPATESPLNSNLKPLDLSHGQCTWCGKYGHRRGGCPLLK